MAGSIMFEGALGIIGGLAKRGLDTVVNAAIAPAARNLAIGNNYNTPNVPPDPGDILGAWLSGYLDDQSAGHWLQEQGIFAFDNKDKDYKTNDKLRDNAHTSVWDQILKSKYPTWTPEVLLMLLNRDYIDRTVVHDHLRRAGWRRKDHRDTFLKLRHDIPSVTDLIQMMRRQGWDDELARRFDLDGEIQKTPEFIYWAKAIGLGGDPAQPNARKLSIDTWAQMYWRVHWISIGPERAMEMYRRLRPSRMPRYRQRLPNLQPFDLEDVGAVLRESDYAPGLRDRLIALGFNLIQKRDLQDARMYDVIDDKELLEQYLDRGLVQEDAERMVKVTLARIATRASARLKQAAVPPVKEAFLSGVLSYDDTVIQLYRTTFFNRKELDFFDAATHDEQAALAKASPDVVFQMKALLWRQQSDRLKEIVAGVKRRYLSGAANRAATEAALRSAGMVSAAIANRLNAWTMLLGAGRRELSVAKILRLARIGVLSTDDADTRLGNLGYLPADRALLLAELKYDVNLQLAKAAEKTARTMAQQQQALARQAAALLRENKRVQRALARTATPAQLERWYVRGLVNDAEFQRRLIAMDKPLTDVAVALAQAKELRRERLARKGTPAKAAPGPGPAVVPAGAAPGP